MWIIFKTLFFCWLEERNSYRLRRTSVNDARIFCFLVKYQFIMTYFKSFPYWDILNLKNVLLLGPFKRPADLSSHSSSGSFHSGRGPVGTRTSCSDKPSGVHSQPNLFPHNNPGPCREDGFGSGHVSESQGYSDTQFLGPPKSKGKANTEKKEKVCPKKSFLPLCAARLKPIRQKTKNAVVSEAIYVLPCENIHPSHFEFRARGRTYNCWFRTWCNRVCISSLGQYPGVWRGVYGAAERTRSSGESQRRT